ncbi:hypothetical protein BJ912DRAFT_686424 [Pholiota molesta]|nr:hypothetical protein BJ912DRAFT_686424 [Pholiota molesta]
MPQYYFRFLILPALIKNASAKSDKAGDRRKSTGLSWSLASNLFSELERLNLETNCTMPSSDFARDQAQKLLRTLCNCLLPVIQGISGQTIDAKEIHFRIEADEFATELEKLISSMITRSQPRSQDIAIEASFEKLEKLEEVRVDNFKGSSSSLSEESSEVATPDDNLAVCSVSSEVNPDQISTNSRAIEWAVLRPMPLSSDDVDLLSHLQNLRRYVTQTLPIRLLLFKPRNGKLKISLIERAEVYSYFSSKLQAAYYNNRKSLPSDWIPRCVKYAILSHTWSTTPGELTYGDWHNSSLNDIHPKYQKLVNFCRAAWKDHRIMLGWIDTVCINKESSAELDESIRSMYKWYSSADVCITYLAATDTVSNMHADPWFTRGWTLQELVAPKFIKFYNMDWNKLSDAANDKNNSIIQEEIELATTITSDELGFFWPPPISRRMQLAAKRQVTREEDIAYCLMGIFGVSISTAYGEGGDRAFFRLVEEIFRSTKDVSDIFNWAGNHKHNLSQQPTSLFPSHPSDYLNCQEFRPWRPIEPLTFTHLGLRTPILLMCAVPIQGTISHNMHRPIGDYHATVSIAPFEDCDGLEVPNSYHLLDKRFDGPEGKHVKLHLHWRGSREEKTSTSILTFGILNVEEQGTSIHIPKACLAVLLQSTVKLTHGWEQSTFPPGYSRIYTEKPIVFPLQKTRNNSDDNNKDYYALERAELAKHGLKLDILYL